MLLRFPHCSMYTAKSISSTDPRNSEPCVCWAAGHSSVLRPFAVTVSIWLEIHTVSTPSYSDILSADITDGRFSFQSCLQDHFTARANHSVFGPISNTEYDSLEVCLCLSSINAGLHRNHRSKVANSDDCVEEVPRFRLYCLPTSSNSFVKTESWL
jgi:hypothetical protein